MKNFFDSETLGVFHCPRCGEDIDLNEFDEGELDKDNPEKNSCCPSCGCIAKSPLNNTISYEESCLIDEE